VRSKLNFVDGLYFIPFFLCTDNVIRMRCVICMLWLMKATFLLK